MKSLVYNVHPIGWATCWWLRRLWPGCQTTWVAGLTCRESDPPQLPGEDWVRVRTLIAGICGTDAAILAQKPPKNSILQAFSSPPMALGHENVAIVEDVGAAVDTSWIGRRVCVEPTLACTARGIDPPCDRCRDGEYGACERFGADGEGTSQLPPATCIGYNSRTGGTFGEQFVAHVSQLVAVPDGMSDEDASLTDPLACGLHAALRADMSEARSVLVYGAGVLGLSIIMALRARGFTGRIDALGRSDYLADMVGSMGADEYVQLPADTRERFEQIARRTGGSVQRARFGNYMLSGGYDVVFECAGSVQSLTETLKWARSRGQVILVGTGSGRGADITPIWFRELSVIGAYGRQFERVDLRTIGTYPLTHELMLSGKLKTAGLLTHTFRLGEYHKAFAVAMHKAPNRAIKVAFDFR